MRNFSILILIVVTQFAKAELHEPKLLTARIQSDKPAIFTYPVPEGLSQELATKLDSERKKAVEKIVNETKLKKSEAEIELSEIENIVRIKRFDRNYISEYLEKTKIKGNNGESLEVFDLGGYVYAYLRFLSIKGLVDASKRREEAIESYNTKTKTSSKEIKILQSHFGTYNKGVYNFVMELAEQARYEGNPLTLKELTYKLIDGYSDIDDSNKKKFIELVEPAIKASLEENNLNKGALALFAVNGKDYADAINRLRREQVQRKPLILEISANSKKSSNEFAVLLKSINEATVRFMNLEKVCGNRDMSQYPILIREAFPSISDNQLDKMKNYLERRHYCLQSIKEQEKKLPHLFITTH